VSNDVRQSFLVIRQKTRMGTAKNDDVEEKDLVMKQKKDEKFTVLVDILRDPRREVYKGIHRGACR
jgi:hypothetical protein